MPANRTRAIALTAATLVAAALLLAACGGSSPSSGAAADSPADSALAFSKCMREHGVKNFPDPETTAGGATQLKFKLEGTSPKTMEAAQQACRHLAEAGGPREEVSPEEKVEREEEIVKFAKCMREHGIEIETSTSGGGVQIQIHPGAGGGPDPESPTFRKAQEACQGLMPGPKGGPSVHGGPMQGKAPPGGGATYGMESAPAGE